MSNVKRKYFIVMVLCFLYGGFAIMASLFLVYSEVLRPELSPDFVYVHAKGDFNSFDRNSFAMPLEGQRIFERYPPRTAALVTSPIFAALLTSGLISLAAGLAIWNLTREKEIKAIKEQAADNLLLPDEKK